MSKYSDLLDLPVPKQEHQNFIHQQLSEILTLLPENCDRIKIDMKKIKEDFKIEYFSNENMDRLKTECSIETLSVLFMLFLSYDKKYKQEKYYVSTDNEKRTARVLLVKNKNCDISIMIKMDYKDLTPEIV